MPETIINVMAENCDFVQSIVVAGIDQFVETLSDAGALIQWSCTDSAGYPRAGLHTSGAFAEAGAGNWPPLVDSAQLSVRYDVIGAIAPFALVLLPIAWIFLYRRGASTRDMLFWGAISVAIPVLGPLATLLLFRRPSDNILS